MKKTTIMKGEAVFFSVISILMQMPLIAYSSDSTAVTADFRLQLFGETLYYSESNGKWYDADGKQLTDTTEPIQTALYEGIAYTVDLAQMQVFAADGAVNGELTALLPQYLAYRPLTVFAINGQYLDDLIGTDAYETAAAQIQLIVQSVPLTYHFSATTEPFYCEISLGSEVLGGMQYSIDAGDAPEAVPWCNDSAGVSLETGSFLLGEVSDSKPTEKTISRIQIGENSLLFDSQSGGWFTSAGSLLINQAEPVQTALYEGNTYTVDLARMQVFAADGTVNDELTALLPNYLAYRPLTVFAINGQYLDDLIGTDAYETAAAQIQLIVQSVPLTYHFSATTEPFYCEISLGSEVLGGIQYSIDAGDAPEAVPWCNESVGFTVETAYTGMGDVDVNGEVNVADAVKLARFLAEDAEAAVTSLGLELSDMNGDGLWRADDLSIILCGLANL